MESERQVVLLLLQGVCRHVGNIDVRGGIGCGVGSFLLLADVEKIDVLGVNSQLSMGCAVLAVGLFFLRCFQKVDGYDRQSEGVVRIRQILFHLK